MKRKNLIWKKRQQAMYHFKEVTKVKYPAKVNK